MDDNFGCVFLVVAVVGGGLCLAFCSGPDNTRTVAAQVSEDNRIDHIACFSNGIKIADDFARNEDWDTADRGYTYTSVITKKRETVAGDCRLRRGENPPDGFVPLDIEAVKSLPGAQPPQISERR